ncbi:nucleotide-diphospho-sugar transferase [Tothia fuscella]|uniref:Nucleotide-diphospho-sugar transferase n=1 Tax=Tothia fuscella TaxID=1048955 RepID=A0A9P4NGW9_9PEZI|nr:nucleotide-diphospho-sugar transferase [Tothia fuscella]
MSLTSKSYLHADKRAESQTPIELYHGPYRILKSERAKVPFQRRPGSFRFGTLFTWCLWLLQIGLEWRIAGHTQSNTAYFMWGVWAALTAEIFLSLQEVTYALNLLFVLFSAEKICPRPAYRLIGDEAPTVDVCITCCGEAVDIIMNTLLAATRQKYPSHCFRVIILDDGRDVNLREAVEALGHKSVEKNNPQVLYRSRQVTVGKRSYYKAGNLQFGIEECGRLGKSEFFACLDADMIPESDWLSSLVPHLILDFQLALANPPQNYYNIPPGDPLAQQTDLDIYFTLYEMLNDLVGGAMCSGTGFVIRHRALEDIGGWPLVDAGEDIICSTSLKNARWKTAHIPEAVQFGLAPESFKVLVKQRIRWTDCGIAVHKKFGFYLNLPGWGTQLTWHQRVLGILLACWEYTPITTFIALIILPLALFTQDSDEFIAFSSHRDLPALRLISAILYLTYSINQYNLFSHIGLRLIANHQSMEIWCAPYLAARCALSLLPGFAKHLHFESTGSIASVVEERSSLRRMPLPQRMLTSDMILYSTYVLYASIPLLLRAWQSFSLGIALYPFPSVILKLFACVWKAGVPLLYMLFPPSVQEWKELTWEDEDGVRRPIVKGNSSQLPHRNSRWTVLGDLLIIWLCF